LKHISTKNEFYWTYLDDKDIGKQILNNSMVLLKKREKGIIFQEKLYLVKEVVIITICKAV
jgi:hypothetical protein